VLGGQICGEVLQGRRKWGGGRWDLFGVGGFFEVKVDDDTSGASHQARELDFLLSLPFLYALNIPGFL